MTHPYWPPTAAGDRTASFLGVSRALGYRPNGESLRRRGDGVDTMVGMRLRRADWVAGSGGDHVQISGFEPCRRLFGLASTDAE